MRSTVTGKVLATVTPPHPYGQFMLVDGTADDRTFLVGAQVWPPHPAGASVGRSRSPSGCSCCISTRPPIPGHAQRPASSAVQRAEPADRVLYRPTAPGSRSRTRTDRRRAWLHVYTLPGGAERTWTPTLAQEGPSDIGLGRDNPASIAWAANDRTISFVWSGKTADGVHLFDTSTPPGDNLVSASRFVLATSPYLGGVPANSSDFVCGSDPFLSANGAYVLCGGYVDPARKAHPAYYPFFPTTPVTQGIGEFSARTGKADHHPRRVARSGADSGHRASSDCARARAPHPYLLWASPDASILIGEAGGHAFVVRNGHRQPIPWSASISTALGSSAPGAAW